MYFRYSLFSLGWRLIRTLCFQHGGVLSVDGTDGLSVRIKFAAI